MPITRPGRRGWSGSRPEKDLAVLRIDAPRESLRSAAHRFVCGSQGRPERARHRQPVRLRPDADHGHHLRPRPRDRLHGRGADPRCHPDRCRHQSRATRAVRCSTAPGGSSGSTPPSSARRAAMPGSASPSRWTPSTGWCRSSSPTVGSGDRCSASSLSAITRLDGSDCKERWWAPSSQGQRRRRSRDASDLSQSQWALGARGSHRRR